ncbi:MAG: hypothetical protein H6722_03685 [Sandaracinus sp.]|nr:hypothetical protein [Sandaracinus sp.]
MGYAFRFLSFDGAMDFDSLDETLAAGDPSWELDDVDDAAGRASLVREGDVWAELELARRGDGVFEGDLDLLRAALESLREGRDTIAAGLDRSVAMLHVRVVWGDRGEEETLDGLDRLWDLLFERWEGLLHAEAEAFYDRERSYELE